MNIFFNFLKHNFLINMIRIINKIRIYYQHIIFFIYLIFFLIHSISIDTVT